MKITNHFKKLVDFYVSKNFFYDYDRIRFYTKYKFSTVNNFVLNRVEHILRHNTPFSYPVGLQLEPTNDCQLSCPYCPRENNVKINNSVYMEWEKYERLLQEIGKYLTTIAFWQWGEPTLHPRLNDMIKFANDYGIISFLSTNGQIDSDKFDFEGLVDSGLSMIIISMDGLSQGAYSSFRESGESEKVKSFLENIVRAKKETGNDRLIVNVRAIATRDNEDELGYIMDHARQAGADLFTVKSISLYYDENPEHPVLPEKKGLRSFQYQGQKEAGRYKNMPNNCCKPWAYPTLRSDGSLLLCECDHSMKYILGNVFEEKNFKAVWKSKKAKNLRSKFNKNGEIDLSFCKNCRYKLDDAIREVHVLQNDKSLEKRIRVLPKVPGF